MSPENFTVFWNELDEYIRRIRGEADELPPARDDELSNDFVNDSLAEAKFLRLFTRYEVAIETCFLHYVTGGVSIGGHQAGSYLNVPDESIARRLTKAGFKFLSWAKPSDIRMTAGHYLHDGWPLVPMLSAREQVLADCERVRNRIAHESTEARAQFGVAQRNYLGTARIFDITPGQFLRLRPARLKKRIILTHFIDTMHETLSALVDPQK